MQIMGMCEGREQPESMGWLQQVEDVRGQGQGHRHHAWVVRKFYGRKDGGDTLLLQLVTVRSQCTCLCGRVRGAFPLQT